MQKQKASNDQLTEAYQRLKSVWKVAELFGMCGQSVHERLIHLTRINSTAYSEDTKRMIVEFYKTGFQQERLKDFCRRNGLLAPNVSRFARGLGLTNRTREHHPNDVLLMGARVKNWIASHGHPKGMLGKRHTKESLGKIRNASVSMWARMSSQKKVERSKKLSNSIRESGSYARNRSRCSWRSGWRTVGGRRIYFRSKWEANYARYLEMLKTVVGSIKEWEHEPKSFDFPKSITRPHSCLPDFRVTRSDGTVLYQEVKGWMDKRSRLQIARMRRYYPATELVVIKAKWFKDNEDRMRNQIHEWE
ncbi:MAG: hypothetical protein WCG75_05720 [Armatimonadota bacterium]